MAAMTEGERLTILKANLDRPGYPNDAFLKHLMNQAEELAKQEGIDTSDKSDIEINSLIIDWAAYLFRKRDGDTTGMPRFLQLERNELLFAQKAAAEEAAGGES